MASRNFDATMTPQNVPATLGLTDGVQYGVQNVDTKATLFVRDAVAVSGPGMRAHRVEAGGWSYLRPGGPTSLWAWTDDPSGCACIVTESE